MAAIAAALLLVPGWPLLRPALAPAPLRTQASEVSAAVGGSRDFALPASTTHVAVHWLGQPDAAVWAALSADGELFGPASRVEVDEVGAARGDGETYGVMMPAPQMRSIRISADRPLERVSVLALDAGGSPPAPAGDASRASGATTMPAIIPRSGWGADESLRYDDAGDEIWTREFFPLQKLVVHHTAGVNDDPDPAATVRAIYYYHAVTQEWGDIGYHYLIDEAGNVYEGRASRDYWNGTSPTADDGAGRVVAGGHARRQNPGTLAVALLGTFDDRVPTPAARASLVAMLAWAADAHGLDPGGSGPYVNPATGLTRSVANIAGHRDYNATACPGTALYRLLPAIRREVAAQVNTWPGRIFNPARSVVLEAGAFVGHAFDPSGAITGSRWIVVSPSASVSTDQTASIPGRNGTWYHLLDGDLAGYWIRATIATRLRPPAPLPRAEEFLPSRPLILAPGRVIGHRFDSFGRVIASATQVLAEPLRLWTAKRGPIPNQEGRWYYIGHGFWDGYWIRETAATELGDPAPPAPPPIATYDPPRVISFAAGTYVGWRFNAFGVPAASKSVTLGARSSAPVSRKATIPGQDGTWYYVSGGVWEDYWIALHPGLSVLRPLAGVPIGPQ